MITTHLLIKDHESSIAQALDSIKPIGGELLIVDLGCTDSTADICRQYGAKVVSGRGSKDFSNLRNRIVARSQYDWQLTIHPWETLDNCDAIINAAGKTEKAYGITIVRGDLATQETRLWHRNLDIQFVNPYYESLDISNDKVENLSCTIHGSGEYGDQLDIINSWCKSNPAAAEPIYYKACMHLTRQEWNAFLGSANKYLFVEKGSRMASVMTNYYMSIVLCHVQKNATEAVRHILECLAVRPLMAEFWCLLGDINYFLIKDYNKASRFYRNAITLGVNRPNNDAWPMETSKYKEYPLKMIDSCEALEKNTAFITKQHHA